MADHEIDIQEIDTETGVPQEEDGIQLIFVWAVAVANTFNLNTAYLLTSLNDLAALGITAAYDATNGTSVFQQINDFYTQGETGNLIWLVGVPMNTAYATFVANSVHDALIMYTAQADPVNRAKIVGYCYAPPTTLQTAADFPADVISLITIAQAKQQAMFKQGYQYACIIDGYNMNSTTLPQNLGSLITYTSFAVAVCVTGTQPNGVSAVGLCMGRIAGITIGHGIGDVEDGGSAAPQAFLTNGIVVQAGINLVVGDIYTVLGGPVTYNSVVYQVGAQFTCVIGVLVFTTAAGGYVADNMTPVGNVPGINNSVINGLTPTAIAQLGQKQYLFLRTWFGKSGLYWNDGATAINTTQAFSNLESNRCVNRLSADALGWFIDKMQSGLPIDKSTGNLSQGWILTAQENFYDKFIEPLNDTQGTGDISDGDMIITGVNLLATKKISFSLNVLPTVLLGGVAGTVKLVASL